ncbi:MAG: cytochrome d ubiquinol oxidase subunit II [Fuerstiella sp.]
MDRETLALIWFIILAVLLTGYAILDGFDLGVGILHPFVARTDEQRRLVMNSIGPLWDGNEVWLVTFGGALFAAFPEAYATVFSSFYLAFMLLLCALIARAVSLEFRSKVTSPSWRRIWDGLFFFGSTLATFLFGLAVGNLMLGLELDANFEFQGTLTQLLNPFSIATGILSLLAFALHGSIFLYLKTEGELQQSLRPVIWKLYVLFAIGFVMISIWTAITIPRATETLNQSPLLWIVPMLNVLALLNISRTLYRRQEAAAFISSSCMIAAFVFLFITALHPFLVPASNNASYGLTIVTAASSQTTLTIMLWIAIIGMPCVLTYSAIIYWTFRGKVQLDEHSY